MLKVVKIFINSLGELQVLCFIRALAAAHHTWYLFGAAVVSKQVAAERSIYRLHPGTTPLGDLSALEYVNNSS